MPERASWRAETGKPVELVHDYAAFYMKPVPASFNVDTTFYKGALRAFVWVICVGCERVRVVVSEGKAFWRYWWHAGKYVEDF